LNVIDFFVVVWVVNVSVGILLDATTAFKGMVVPLAKVEP
jgi:hypothetical protein